jgi:hypothetical protein
MWVWAGLGFSPNSSAARRNSLLKGSWFDQSGLRPDVLAEAQTHMMAGMPYGNIDFLFLLRIQIQQ